MRRSRWLLAGLAAGVAATLMLGAARAEAAIMSATFQGEVTDGIDRTGVFGAAGADLTGQAFILNYVFDTAVGPFATSVGPALVGGTSKPSGAQPVLQMSLTIAGQTQAYKLADGAFFSAAVQYGIDWPTKKPGTTYQNSIFFSVQPGLTSSYLGYLETDEPVPNDFTTPFTVTANPGQDDQTTFGFPDATAPNGRYALHGHASTFTVGRYAPPVLIDQPDTRGAVPEPGTWVMMILGFGATGAALRRRSMVLA